MTIQPTRPSCMWNAPDEFGIAITSSVIKADIGSTDGHICPSRRLLDTVASHVRKNGVDDRLIPDSYLRCTGDDIAAVVSNHQAILAKSVPKLAWEAFLVGIAAAHQQSLYRAGHNLLRDSFSGNARGTDPAVAAAEFDERPNEPFLFAADKADPGHSICRCISPSLNL